MSLFCFLLLLNFHAFFPERYNRTLKHSKSLQMCLKIFLYWLCCNCFRDILQVALSLAPRVRPSAERIRKCIKVSNLIIDNSLQETHWYWIGINSSFLRILDIFWQEAQNPFKLNATCHQFEVLAHCLEYLT